MTNFIRRFSPLALAATLVLSTAVPAAAAVPAPTPSPPASPAAPAPLAVAMGQQAVSRDPIANVAQVAVTVTPTAAVAPWQYAFAVRGTVVASGSSSAAAFSVTLANNCSITTQSVTVTVTDAAGSTGSAAGTLDRSLCPPPPNVPHAADRIVAVPTLAEDSFVDRLRAVASPALAEGRAIYRTLVAAGINPAFALGTFQAESSSGTRGYAVTTLNWGNILYYAWEAAYGAVPYAPGNGYTYARYPTWLAGAQAYAHLLTLYHQGGYITVSSASAHWLGTVEGSARHLTYLRNITAVMSILPDDQVPTMTSLTVPTRSRAAVTATWTAKDNLGVVGYQVRTRRAGGTWSKPAAVAGPSQTLTLTTGTWTVGVRATDAAGNWSAWRGATVVVDATVPAMTRLASTESVVRAVNGVFTASWSARDNVGIVRYQWRTRRDSDPAWAAPGGTKGTTRTFKLPAGAWFVAVRAADAVGNWSPWRTIRVVVPVDDRAYAFSSGTIRRSSSVYYRGTVTMTSRTSSRLRTTFTGRDFYLIGTAGPGYGRLRVTIDTKSFVVDAGNYAGRRATSTHFRTRLLSVRMASGKHIVTITNLGTPGRPRIAIDGLGFAL